MAVQTPRADTEQPPDRQHPDASRLNLGSGEDYRDDEAWLNLDYSARYDPDVVHDLNDPAGWPFPDNCFEQVLARHVFEHLDDLSFQFQEAARVLKPGGRLDVWYPVGMNARTDPTHQHYLTYDSAVFFAQNHDEYGPHYQIEAPAPFDLEERELASAWVHGAFSVTKPVFRLLRWHYGDGLWVSDWPGMSGEVHVRYRRQDP